VDANEFTFTDFSNNAFYRSENANLIEMTGVGPGQRIVDLACGNGGMTKLILERLRGARDSVIIGIDHSSDMLKLAMEDLKDARDAAVLFCQSRVEQVSEAVKESVDTVFFCNAIHYIPDKGELVDEISKLLKPGGKLAFNTSFFDGAHPPETMVFARQWMMKSARILRRDYGLSPVRAEKVQSRRQLTPEQYRGLVEQHGFRVEGQEIDKVQVPIKGWLDISGFKDFIDGVMPGVPMDKAKAALQTGCEQVFAEMKVDAVPRNWLRMVAVRV
jgi:ubiquinone/menaquinone biosynthesis C-methylase UbiE